MRGFVIVGGLACFLVFSGTARADVDGWATPEGEPQIYGGQETEQCGWPSVVYLSTGGAACTGALVHPMIVLTAAHCIPGNATASVRFGERGSTGVELAKTDYCRANPAFNNTGGGQDYGFCKLATPVTNVPIIPIAYGCEESVIATGRQVTHVGFGVDESGQSGRKKSVAVNLSQITASGELITGTHNTGICSGDSGGPTFIRLASSLGGDDTWRVIGIHSWAQMSQPGECNGSAGSILASRAVNFIKQESGIDVTPCHTSDGQWAPTWACQGFPIEPGIGGTSSYQAGCDTGPLGDFSELCGPPLTAFPDDTAPLLQVIEPLSDVEVEVDAGGSTGVRVHAEADDGEGWGVAGVELIIAPEDGEMVSQTLEYPPYVWNTTFPVGAYNLKLIATDHAGNATESDWIGVGVGTPPPSSPPGGDDAADDGEGETGEGGGGDPTGEPETSGGPEMTDTEAPSGCGCRTRDEELPMAGFVLLLGGILARRRQSAPVRASQRARA
jgi:MYXO-CTERM domain-containing protein